MHFRPFSYWGRTLLAGCATLLGASVVLGQSSSAATAATADQSTSRIDVFTGYSYIAPHGTVVTPEAGGTNTPLDYSAINYGAIGSFAYYFNRYVGGQVEYANHPNGMNDGAQTLQGGIIFRYPTEGMAVFVHALGGGVRLGGPNISGPGQQPKHIYTWGPALTAGVGLDYDLPFGGHRIAWRIFQGDYEYWHADFGYQEQIGGRANVSAVRLSTGLLFHFGSIAPPPPVQYACTITPSSVFPGEQVTVTGTATNLNPKKTPAYSWSGQGLTVGGTSPTSTIDTGGLQPGSYTVTGTATDPKEKKNNTASCNGSFTVKQPHPPTASCSASPDSVKAGDPSTVTVSASSPDNFPLTYAWSSTAGHLSGTGASATLDTNGAAQGSPITATATVTDSRGLSTTCNATVNILPPPPPVTVNEVSEVGECKFMDPKRPWRVDNTCKAILDDVAMRIQRESNGKFVIVGYTDEEETAKVTQLGAQRAVNMKYYLVHGEGGSQIDASRIEVRTGSTVKEKGAKVYFVPSGATFSEESVVVDESQVKGYPRNAPAPRKVHHKASSNQTPPSQ